MCAMEIYPLQKARKKLGLTQKTLADLTGLSEPTIKRAERGDALEDYTISAIYDYFSQRYGRQVDRKELGLHAKWENTHTLIPNQQEQLFTEHLPSAAYECLARVLAKSSAFDMKILHEIKQITQIYWSLRARIGYRPVLPGLLGHLETIIQLLDIPHAPTVHTSLRAYASEVAQYIGAIYFDMQEYLSARSYYEVAMKAAEEAEHITLQATSLGRKSALFIYRDNPREAVLLLERALQIAGGHSSGMACSDEG